MTTTRLQHAAGGGKAMHANESSIQAKKPRPRRKLNRPWNEVKKTEELEASKAAVVNVNDEGAEELDASKAAAIVPSNGEDNAEVRNRSGLEAELFLAKLEVFRIQEKLEKLVEEGAPPGIEDLNQYKKALEADLFLAELAVDLSKEKLSNEEAKVVKVVNQEAKGEELNGDVIKPGNEEVIKPGNEVVVKPGEMLKPDDNKVEENDKVEENEVQKVNTMASPGYVVKIIEGMTEFFQAREAREKELEGKVQLLEKLVEDLNKRLKTLEEEHDDLSKRE